MSHQPSYFHVFLTFARNSLIRDMTFRTNFLLECVSSASWTLMNVGFYLIVFHHARYLGAGSPAGEVGEGPGWDRYEFFVFLATTWFINSLVQAFFMPNAQEFSELIRTGNLDFALLKPIDTQFLVSCHRVEWSSLVNVLTGGILMGISLWKLTTRRGRPSGPGAAGDRAVPGLHPDGRGHPVQPDDFPGGDQHLAGAEPDAL